MRDFRRRSTGSSTVPPYRGGDWLTFDLRQQWSQHHVLSKLLFFLNKILRVNSKVNTTVNTLGVDKNTPKKSTGKKWMTNIDKVLNLYTKATLE